MDNPMAWAALFLALGAYSWPFWEPPLSPLLGGVVFLGALALAGRRFPAAKLACAAGAFLAGAGAVAALPAPPALPERAYVQGVVRDRLGTRADVDSPSGRLTLHFRGEPEAPPVGTALAAWTEPPAPPVRLPGELGGRWDLRRRKSTPRDVKRWVRLGPPPPPPRGPWALSAHGGLLRALATGERAEIPADVTALLRRTGTAHLLSISGLHLALVAGMAHGLAWALTRPLAFLPFPRLVRALPPLLALAAATAYGASVGWPVATRRSLAMVALAVLARLLGRPARAWSLLGLAGVGVVLADPAQVAEPAAWMSFGAVAGMIAWSPAITRWLPPDSPRILRATAAALGASVGATLGTLPAVALLYQELSPLSPLANLLTGPLLGGVAVGGALLAYLLPGGAGLLALAVGDAAVEIGLGLLRLVDVAPWTCAVTPAGALLLAAILPLRRRPLLAAALAACAFTLKPQPEGRLEVTFLPIGQGDAALVEWPDGRRWLVDGGPPSDRLLRYLRRRGITRLDAVFLSHPHPDHMGGLQPVIERLAVGELWVPRPPEADEPSYLDFWQAAFARGVPVRFPGDPLPASGAAILHPLDGWRARKKRSRVNEESLVLRIQHGGHSFLFTGDVEEEAEAHLAATLARASVVKVAHHGSKTSSSEEFAAALQPSWAVIPCGRGNRYGHPHAITLARWRGAAIARTDEDGALTFATDGASLSVRRWWIGDGWRPLSRTPPPPVDTGSGGG